MKQAMVAVSKALIRGLLIVVPVYLAILLLLKGMKSVANLVRPFTALLPDWVPAEELLSLLLVLAICAVIGATVGTRIGRGARDWLERSVFVPSIPTPFAGAVYVLDRQRVHPVDVPFTEAIRVISRWGSGAQNLVAAMERGKSVASR
jgi:uncharacterized membrane protein